MIFSQETPERLAQTLRVSEQCVALLPSVTAPFVENGFRDAVHVSVGVNTMDRIEEAKARTFQPAEVRAHQPWSVLLEMNCTAAT
jgi:hypothetical protein